MIRRIVKMTFDPAGVDDFLTLFESNKNKIRSFNGCEGLQLLREENIFFTFSVWRDVNDLENYRKSELFGIVWPATKKLLERPAEAWTTEIIYDLE